MDYSAEESRIKRKQKLAEALMAKSQSPQGQMVGRFYVAPNALQGIAGLANQFAGKTMMEDSETQAADLAKQRKDALVKTLGGVSPDPDVGALLQNPDTMDFGQKLMLSRMDASRKLQEAKDLERFRTDENIRQATDPRVIASKRDASKPQPKPMPAAALKMQQEELDAIGIASSIQSDLGSLVNQIDQGKLDFGPVTNALNVAKNAVGASDEGSRNFSTFKSSLEKLRNDSLRLNKGVQTEGDAVRAWNELFQSINDKDLVRQRLEEIRAINERASTMRQMNVDNIRRNYGAEELDTKPYVNQPSAVGNTQSVNQQPKSKYSNLWGG